MPTLEGIVVIDIETTGLLSAFGKIVEIAAVYIPYPAGWTRTLISRMCNPGLPVDDLKKAWICRQGFLTPDDILAGQSPEQVALALKSQMGNLPWIAYNSSFEHDFLQRKPWRLYSPAFDLMEAMTDLCGSYRRWSEHLIASNLAKAHRFIGGRRPKTRHRALYDAYMAVDLLLWLIEENYYKLENLPNILIPLEERPICEECKCSMQWNPKRDDWHCQRCWDYHFRY